MNPKRKDREIGKGLNWFVSFNQRADGSISFSLDDQFGAAPPREEVQNLCKALMGFYENLTIEEQLDRAEWSAIQWFYHSGGPHGWKGGKIRDKYPTMAEFKASPEYVNYLKNTDKDAYEALFPPKPIIPPKGPTPGFVYLLSTDMGIYKIGKTINLKNRLSNFGLVLPFKVELAHTIKSDDYSRAETELHRRFANRRSSGEWFNLTKPEVEWVKAQSEINYHQKA